MKDTIVIGGEISLLNAVDGETSLLNVMDGECGTITKIESDPHETYSGDYLITPKTTSQTFDTANKIMQEDITVVAIPYFETSNQEGTTVYIANTI